MMCQIFQKISLTFPGFQRLFEKNSFSRFSRICGNPVIVLAKTKLLQSKIQMVKINTKNSNVTAGANCLLILPCMRLFEPIWNNCGTILMWNRWFSPAECSTYQESNVHLYRAQCNKL